MEELDEDIGNFIWNNIGTLDNFFPSKVYQKLLSLKQENEKSNFIDDLELIFDMNNEILENIKESFFIDTSNFTIIDMIFLLKKYLYNHYIERAKKFINSDISNEMAELLEIIANFYEHNNQYDNALKFYKKTLNIDLKLYGENHPNIAISYNDIGLIYKDIAQYNKALFYLNKALEIFLKNINTASDIAMSYNNIGLVYQDIGDYRKALDYHNKSLKIKLKIYGENNPKTTISYNNIGIVYNSLREFKKALEYHNKALEIRLKIFGECYPDTAISYSNLADVYTSLGKYEKALEYYYKDYNIMLKLNGSDYLYFATSYNNIGAVYRHLSNYKKALEYYNKAWNIFLKVFGDKHPNSILTYKNIEFVKNKIFLSKNPKLDKAKITNFKLLENFEIDFTKNINIIIGENSRGKTSLLQAITLGLVGENYSVGVGSNSYKKYVTKEKERAKIKLTFEDYEGDITIFNNRREVTNQTFYPKNLSPFVLAYGCNIFVKYTLDENSFIDKLLAENINDGFTNSIFEYYTETFKNPQSVLTVLARKKELKAQKIEKLMRGIINYFIDDFKLEKNESGIYFFKSNEGKYFNLDELSEGYRTNIILISDILIKIFGTGKKPKIVSGAILIDEFDKHLNPKWQTDLISKLKKRFPNIQFILTTHNPMSILDRNPDEITIIKKTDEGKLIAIKDIGTKNIDVGTVLLKYFGVDSLVGKEMREKINELTALKLKGDLSEKEFEKLDELEDYFEYTPATNFIYNQAYFNFLIFLKNNENIDFRDYEKMKDKEMVKLMEKFKDLF